MVITSHARLDAQRVRSAPRQIFLFLLGADVSVLIIYLLVLPSVQWESLDTRVRAIASLAASGAAYFGLDRLIRKRARRFGVVLDSIWVRALLVLVTPFLWLGILPVWSCSFVFNPTQESPPEIIFAGKSRQWVTTNKRTPRDEPIYQVDGLLLRNYEYSVQAKRQTSYYLPAISILKWAAFHQPVILQMPCMVQLPYDSGAKVTYRRFQEDKETTYGDLPDDGRIYLLPGHYDYIRIQKDERSASSSLDVKCPLTELDLEMQLK